MTDFAWAVIGPGAVARQFAAAVAGLEDARVHSVCGRDPARLAAFIAASAPSSGEPPRAVRQLDDVLDDPAVDAVYVATPHALHGEAIRRCLEAGKPVLCEKPMVPNRAQLEALAGLAQRRRVFLMEAVWTRYLPVYGQVAAWLRDEAIGPLQALQSSICFLAPYDPASRLFDPALAGGALLDLGVYSVTMTQWVLQQAAGSCAEPTDIHAAATLAPSGVDQRVSAVLSFPGGLSSRFVCGLDGPADNGLTVLGERGVIRVAAPFWGATGASLHRDGEAPVTVQADFRFNGFEYEIEEAQRCIRAGLVESPRMRLHDSITALAWMDEIRRQVGVRYPFE